MKAIQVHSCGGPASLSYENVAEPTPTDSQVLIELEAIGVNFIDTYHRSGLYKKPLPFIPGIEGVGRILQASERSGEFSAGQRVAFCDASASYAERVAVDAERIVPVPPELAAEQACALMVQGLTAHYLARSTFLLREGHRCLIHAGAGGLGLLLTQLAKLQGAYVYTTVSTKEKQQLSLKAGADKCINYTEQDFAQVIKQETEGQGLDVVYDSVGKATFSGSLSCLKPRGLMVSLGNASGAVPAIAPLELASGGSLFLTRPKLFDYIQTSEELRCRAAELFALHQEGKLTLHFADKYPLQDAEKAHQALESRSTVGKLILLP